MSAAIFCDDGSGLLHGPTDGLCLDFVNTRAWRLATVQDERLTEPAALLRWCTTAGILSAPHATRLAEHWEESPEDAHAAYGRALALREAIYALLRSKIALEKVSGQALQVLNAALEAAPRRVRLTAVGATFAWSVETAEPALPDVLLAPVSWSAAGLLTGPRADRVRQCADDRGCGWLFLSTLR